MSARPPLVLNLWRNPASLAVARIVTPTNTSPAAWSTFRNGDTLPIQFNISDGAGDYETLTGRTYRVGMGGLNNPVTSGQFTLSDGVAVSQQIAFNATAATVQTALNSMNGNTGPYGSLVYVTGGPGAPYKIVWQSNGAHSPLTVNIADLAPTAVSNVTEEQVGSGSQPEIQLLQINAQPYAISTSWGVSGVTFATGELVIASGQLNEALGENPSLPTFFEIEENDGSGDVTALVQAPVTINGPALPLFLGAPAPFLGNQTFNTPIPGGNSSYAITFPVAYGTAPTKFSYAISFSGTPTGVITAVFGNITPTGCTVYFSGAPSGAFVLTLTVAP